MKKLKDDDPMPFGMYKGIMMIDVPASYLIFIYEESKCTPQVAFYIRDNLEALELEIKNSKK